MNLGDPIAACHVVSLSLTNGILPRTGTGLSGSTMRDEAAVAIEA
jgi:hypothetical protein